MIQQSKQIVVVTDSFLDRGIEVRRVSAFTSREILEKSPSN
jgi:hypothetical protein